MHTANEENEKEAKTMITVSAETRQKLKVIAALRKETMVDVVKQMVDAVYHSMMQDIN